MHKVKKIICYLSLVIVILFTGCSSDPAYTPVKEYEVIDVKGVDLEIKNFFGYTVNTIKNDSYDVTYIKNGQQKTINLGLGEYGLNKLRTGSTNYLKFEDKGIDTYITLFLTQESQEKWDVSY